MTPPMGCVRGDPIVRLSLKPFWRRDAMAEGGAEADAEAQPAQALVPYESALQALAAQPGDSLALSVRLPFCAAHCLFCNRQIHAAQPLDVIDRYVQALSDEAAMVAQRVGRDRDVLQLHLGGGSANDLTEVQLLRVVDALHAAWRLPSDAELSVECDPRRVSRQHLDLLRGLGFRHVSFGVADLDATVQRAIGRRNSDRLIEDVCAAARCAGIERVQLELLIGLPHQSLQSWQCTLGRVIEMAPDRVVLARYQHGPDRTAGQRAIDSDVLPDAALCGALQALSIEVLHAAGYAAISSGHFVLDDDELALAHAEGRLRLNLIGCTATPAVPVIGLGAGAIGQIDDALYLNHVGLPDWHAALAARRLPVAHVRHVQAQGLD